MTNNLLRQFAERFKRETVQITSPRTTVMVKPDLAEEVSLCRRLARVCDIPFEPDRAVEMALQRELQAARRRRDMAAMGGSHA